MNSKTLFLLSLLIFFLNTEIFSQPVVKNNQTNAINRILGKQDNKNTLSPADTVLGCIGHFWMGIRGVAFF